ncbi:MAG: ABC transporter substrate-binding protein [Caldimonas sp.]
MLEAIAEHQNTRNLDALRSGLRQLGYIEGRNLRIEYRSADGRAERFRDLAQDLVRLKVDVILSRGTPATLAATSATSSIPVVMATMGGPQAVVVGFGPGSNVTGVTTFSTELTAKRLELLKELAPRLSRVAMIHNMANPAAPPEWQAMQEAARALRLQAVLIDVSVESDILRAADRAADGKIDGVVVGADGLMQGHQRLLVDALNGRGLVASYPGSEFVEGGGLMAYAVNFSDLYARLAVFVDKIIKGGKPSAIPVEGPTKFELAINLHTAKLLGLTVPGSLLLRADRLIQ